ncbi:MAG: hypothetical protein QOJ42_5582, partial [Acidobacteriaceae bacterium]|nr:hypothetical protein [Acidobacteriaceae bacterium]
LLDDDGNALESWDDRAVTVVGLNEEAQATVDYFALNTPWYDRNLGAVIIPKAFFQAGEVRLLWQRTAVYFAAQRLVEAIFSADDRATVIAQGRRLMAAAGFWSTWATDFAQTLPPADRGLLEQLLLPPQPDHWELGPGGHRPFPGTNFAVV